MKIILKFLLLVLLMMWTVYAQSQELPRRPFKDIQVNNTNTKDINNKPYTDQQSTAKSLSIFNTYPTTPGDIQAQNKTKNTCKESFYNKLVGWSTVVLAIVTTILAFYTYKLWSATKETAQSQLRAYIFVGLAEGEKLSIDENGFLIAPLIIKNYGQTPADKLQCSVFIGRYKLPLSEILDPPNYTNSSLGCLAPTQFFSQYPSLPRKLSPIEETDIISGVCGIYVWGYLEYIDIFKIHQTTQFRMISTGTDFSMGKLAYCKEGNETT